MLTSPTSSRESQRRNAERPGLHRQCRRDHASAIQRCLGTRARVATRSTSGQPQNDPDAMKLWGRQYEKGWEPESSSDLGSSQKAQCRPSTGCIAGFVFVPDFALFAWNGELRTSMQTSRLVLNGNLSASNRIARQINRKLIFNQIRVKQPISRAELARTSGLQRSTVSLIVEELLTDRWVVEGSTGRDPTRKKADLS